LSESSTKFDVTIVIVTANDEKNIGRLLDQIYLQDYSMDKVEVVLVDAFSGDKTRQIVDNYKDRFGSFKVLDNPARTRAAGWNVGIN
jgi:glycosyltransferase involved in cell wall biosynthesis